MLHVGGNYNQNQNHGAFYLNGNNAASNANANIGCRHLAWLTTSLLRVEPFPRFDIDGWNGRTALAEDLSKGHSLVPSPAVGAGNIVRQQGEIIPVKRVGHLYEKLISDENLRLAILEVNKTHRWRPRHKPNKTVRWVERTADARIAELRSIIEEGFTPSPTTPKRRWDKSAGKWRDIYEPRLWPDQYVHHALVQVLQPVMMRGMDPWCCGSIRGRGVHYGAKAMAKWNKNDRKGTRWCAELDIYHFYESLRPGVVLDRMRRLVKDRRVLDLVERVTKDGILIGAYFSQWFANTALQPLDHAIRGGGITHYLRYVDNFTIYARSKRALGKLIQLIGGWLAERGMRLKGNWQKFRTADRLPCALGYRYGKGYTLLRKRNLLRLARQLRRYYRKLRRGARIPVSMAAGLLSRLGQLRHCNSTRIYRRMVRPKTQRHLKNVLRAHMRKERQKWNEVPA